MKRFLMVALTLTLILGAGVVHGLWAGRWSAAGAPEQAAARLALVPAAFGDWVGEDQELDRRQVEVANLSGYLARQYVNQRTGSVVTLLLVCGRPGPVSVHVPEVCYTGAGFAQVGEKVRGKIDRATKADYFALRFNKPQSVTPQTLRVVYAWGASGAWSAPDNPRLAFFREPALYKLYVIRQLPREDEALEEDPAVEFLGDLLPRAQQALFGDS